MLEGGGPVLVGGVSGGHHGVGAGGGDVGVVDVEGAVQLHEGGLAHTELAVVLVVVEDGLRLVAAPTATVPLLEGAVGVLGAGNEDVVARARLVEGGGVAQVVVATEVDHAGVTVGEVIHGALGGSQDDLLLGPGVASVIGAAVGDPVPLARNGTHAGEVGVDGVAVLVVQVGHAVAVAPGLILGEAVDVVALIRHGHVDDLARIGLDQLDDVVGIHRLGGSLGGLLGGSLSGLVTVGLGGRLGDVGHGGIGLDGGVGGGIALITAYEEGGNQEQDEPQQKNVFFHDRIPFKFK